MKPQTLQTEQNIALLYPQHSYIHSHGQLCKTSRSQIAALGQRLLSGLEAHWLRDWLQVVIDLYCGGSLRFT